MLEPQKEKKEEASGMPGCFGAPFVWAGAVLNGLKERLEPGIPFPHLPPEGVIVATVTKLEKGCGPKELTVHLTLEEKGIGFNGLSLPLHQQPECDASWYELKQGEKIQLKYKQEKGNQFNLMVSTERAWWESAG